MIQVGATVGNYQVLQKIGAGAMGNVFMAHHPVIGKRVALKVIHPELAGNEEMVSRFFNEARAVTQIGHENIVDVQDFGQTPDGDSFIVMELLEGSVLGDVIKHQGALSVPRATHIALQMSDGLAAAHARGIIHRDLKPDNVFLINRGGDPDFVKILDFGLAKLTGPSAMNNQTKTGSLLGTPHYMAPEQAENVKKVDHRADIYSLGCMMFQMLTGRVPFPGEGFGEVLVRHVREPPPLPSRLNPLVPPALEKIVLHALAKKPEFRFGSMEDFRAALRDPERFARTLDGQGVRTPDGGMSAIDPLAATGPGAAPPARGAAPVARGAPPPAAGYGPPPPAPGGAAAPAPPIAAPRVGQDAPTMMAAAPDLEAVRRNATMGSNGGAVGPIVDLSRHEAPTAPTGRRPDPERIVQPKPARPTVASPHLKLRPPPKSRLGWIVGLGALAVAGGLAWYFLAGPGRGGNVTVTVTTTPPGVTVLDGEKPLGVTPLALSLPRSAEPKQLSFRKEGFFGAQRVITPKENQALPIRLLPVPKSEDEPAAVEAAPVKPVAAPPVAVAKPLPPPTVKAAPAVKPPPAVTAAPAVKPPPARPEPTPPPVAARPPKPVVEPPADDKPKHKKKLKKEDTLILTPSF